MRRLEFWKLGLQNVMAASLRSVLTVLGMAIGVAAILAVVTLGQAGQIQVQQEISRLGIDKVMVTAADQNQPLTNQDRKLLADRLKTQADETVCLECTLSVNGQTDTAMLVGCEPDEWQGLNPTIAAGNSLLPSQWYTGSSTAMIGINLAKSFQIAPGDWLSAGGIMLQCSGLIGETQQATQLDLKESIIVPKTLLKQWIGESIQQIAIHVPDNQTPESIAAQAESLLFAEHALRVNINSMQTQAEAANSILKVFIDILRWVALICMIVGGIGVTNILLVSVRERRREIGVMQSLGATQFQICGLFLCEALIYALAGGILGLLLGGALIAVAGGSIGLSPVIRAADCTAVFMSAVFLGLLSGVAPAAGASRMKPVDALRED
ncbi:MAG: ABC transporter permease [Clostridia bacterium]|nr:ABC transporter permease [Clostridia bacterium]